MFRNKVMLSSSTTKKLLYCLPEVNIVGLLARAVA